ncbi:MAG: mechanosensitive ion channel family protein [Pseudanabaena sp. ELA645]|jgi:small conductance mechanosensitive channel
MMSNRQNQIKEGFWKKRFRNSGLLIMLLVSAIALSLFLNSTPIAWGQSELLNLNKLISGRYNSNSNIANVDSAPLKLDGYQLFLLAAPSVNQRFPLEQRVKGIEEELNRVANSNFDPNTLQVTTSLDEKSDQSVINIDNRYLMTVTTLDAQIHGGDPQRWANSLTQIIGNALMRAHQERQPIFLRDRSLFALGIFIAAIATNRLITKLEKYLKKRKQVVESKIDDELDTKLDIVPLDELQQQLSLKQKFNLDDLQQRILQIGQIGIIGSGIFVILGLFPYTRWLQSFIISTPLQVLGIILVAYVLIRISNLLIARFAIVLKEKDFMMLKPSQRLELRVSTITQVLTNVVAIFWVCAASLMSLSVIGVDLIPLLAGAGIVGLAISFAAQGLIKDIINGFLIILEDQYAVGDVIVVGALGGLVENMNLRITQIRNNEGQLITIPNSAIAIVQNLSKDWARVDLTIQISYETDPDHALAVLQKLSQEIYAETEWQSKILEIPEVLGIDDLQHSGMLIRIWIKTQPLQQWAVGREFRRRLQMVMQKEGIAIGIPRQALFVQTPLAPDTPPFSS